jgi:hypothetical protein
MDRITFTKKGKQKMFTSWVEITLALSVTVERVIETLWSVLEHKTDFIKRIQQANPAKYRKYKEILSFILGIVLGLCFAPYGAALIDSNPIDPKVYLTIGVVAGAFAPYSHQMISLINDIREQLQADNTQGSESAQT